jgi:rod shape-determining protein MreD
MKRFLLLLAGGLFIILLQALPLNFLFAKTITPNLSLAFMIFIALFYPSMGSWLLAFLLGYVLETFSGYPPGLLILINLAILLLIRGTNRVMSFENPASQLALVFFLNVLIDLFLLAVSQIAINNPLGLIMPKIFVNSFLTVLLSAPLFVFYNNSLLTSEG